MANILERVANFAQKEGLTISSIEKTIGASKGVLSRALAQGTDIQAKWIEAIAENYPQISPVWLLTGEGDMLIEEALPKLKVGDTIENNAGSVVNRSQISSEVMQALSHSQEAIIGQLAVKDAQIAAQQNTINDLLAFINASGINK